ncbi:MAG: hypothetical protein DPW16_13230 [Chloroflexi bacterium]|nr:hypothetical protein [Chloroflexota bacterium]
MKRLVSALLLLGLMVGGVSWAQDGGSPLAPAEIPGEALYIPFPVAITLDGDLSDWAGVPVSVVDRGPSPSANPAENGSFTVAVAADGDNLYIAMTMPDQNIITGQHGSEYWNEDSLEFYLNLSGDLATRTYGDTIFQVNINAGNIGNTDPAAIIVSGVNGSKAPVQAFVFKTADGWGFEAQVALNGLITPSHGLEIGFQAHANGASSADRDVKLIWSNADKGDNSWQNPSVFGRGIFFEVGSTDIPTPAIPEEPAGFEMDDADWPALVRASWEGYKQNYIFCGENCGNNMGLVFDPNMGYQSVSEGIGYGMLMAVLMNDPLTFNTIYDAAYQLMLDSETGLLNWRIDNTGTITGFGSATDAEEDIALALIFAEKRVERSEWTQHPERAYGEYANRWIDAIYEYEVGDGRYLTPGDDWAGEGQEILNLSYFSPAWYRIFDDFQGTTRWQPVITYGYRTLYVTDGARLGLAPDWSTSEGGPAYDYCNATGRPLDGCKYEMTYDAIRVPWRIGLDCIWFGDSRACDWSKRSARFLNTLPPDQFARMYDMNGVSVVDYQNELMVAMWLVAAHAAEDTALENRLGELLYGYAGSVLGSGYWSGTSQFYFGQSLAWFGAAVVSDDFRNLYAEP